ncbi:unnamed protein product [Auanema sp. JU1783]|nr:unnamed protein product [Auanema sp. JU1783]
MAKELLEEEEKEVFEVLTLVEEPKYEADGTLSKNQGRSNLKRSRACKAPPPAYTPPTVDPLTLCENNVATMMLAAFRMSREEAMKEDLDKHLKKVANDIKIQHQQTSKTVKTKVVTSSTLISSSKATAAAVAAGLVTNPNTCIRRTPFEDKNGNRIPGIRTITESIQSSESSESEEDCKCHEVMEKDGCCCPLNCLTPSNILCDPDCIEILESVREHGLTMRDGNFVSEVERKFLEELNKQLMSEDHEDVESAVKSAEKAQEQQKLREMLDSKLNPPQYGNLPAPPSMKPSTNGRLIPCRANDGSHAQDHLHHDVQIEFVDMCSEHQKQKDVIYPSILAPVVTFEEWKKQIRPSIEYMKNDLSKTNNELQSMSIIDGMKVITDQFTQLMDTFAFMEKIEPRVHLLIPKYTWFHGMEADENVNIADLEKDSKFRIPGLTLKIRRALSLAGRVRQRILVACRECLVDLVDLCYLHNYAPRTDMERVGSENLYKMAIRDPSWCDPITVMHLIEILREINFLEYVTKIEACQAQCDKKFGLDDVPLTDDPFVHRVVRVVHIRDMLDRVRVTLVHAFICGSNEIAEFLKRLRSMLAEVEPLPPHLDPINRESKFKDNILTNIDTNKKSNKRRRKSYSE